MKKAFLLCSLTILTGLLPRPGAGAAAASAIPDGNPSGIWSTVSVSGAGPFLTGAQVTLNLSGGYNGDLYAYLSHGGASVTLLNRIGLSASNPFGSAGNGMSTTLTDSAGVNIHAAGNGYLTGSYRADGQAISPLSSPGSFDPNGGQATLLGTFGALEPNGEWTLFIADVLSGGGTAILNGWELQITTIPEPAGFSLWLVGILLTRIFHRVRRWSGWSR